MPLRRTKSNNIVFKQRGSLPPGQWRLVAYDIATGRTTRLAEKRSVDDQVEWPPSELEEHQLCAECAELARL